MKITNLIIKNYKNLDAEIKHQSDLIALIGNNGSGKSNILEAISHIFRSLYVKKAKADFDYTIEYTNTLNQRIKIDKKGSQLKYFLNEDSIIDINQYLPKKIIAIYSGEDERLYEDCFEPFYNEFVKGINKASFQGTDFSNLPKMLYLNKFYWNISLLSLLISDSEDNKRFVKEILKISSVNKIKIDLNTDNYREYNDNLALNMVRKLEGKTEYNLEEFKKIMADNYYTADDVYKYLYLAFTPENKNIIKEIVIMFNSNLTVSELSEGEKKLILIRAALEFAGQEDCLFILDEPDAHIHVNNKEQITKSFEPYQHNRQIIITTHSPTLTQCVKDENVYMLNNGTIEDRTKQDIINEITGEFWNRFQQNSFLASKKPIILLVEGKHDKIHITNAYRLLKVEFEEIDFDIFSLGSESKIAPFLRGLNESEICLNKTFIAIYDNDKAGKDSLNGKDYEKIADYMEFRKLKKDKIEHNNLFAIVLPKPFKFTDDCTIENLLDPKYYKEAFKIAFEDEQGFNNKSIKKIEENITTNAKNRLCDLSNKISNKEEFNSFRRLFELVKNIVDYKSNPEIIDFLSVGQGDIFITPKGDNSLPLNVDYDIENVVNINDIKVEKSIKKITNDDFKYTHLKFWTQLHKFVDTQKVSFKLQKAAHQHWMYVSVGKSDFNICIISNTKKKYIRIQLLCRGENALANFNALRDLYEADSKINLSPIIKWEEKVGKKEHHINFIIDKNPLEIGDWQNQHQLICEWVEKYYIYFKDKIQVLKVDNSSSDNGIVAYDINSFGYQLDLKLPDLNIELKSQLESFFNRLKALPEEMGNFNYIIKSINKKRIFTLESREINNLLKRLVEFKIIENTSEVQYKITDIGKVFIELLDLPGQNPVVRF